jgi:hypothetical protein
VTGWEGEPWTVATLRALTVASGLPRCVSGMRGLGLMGVPCLERVVAQGPSIIAIQISLQAEWDWGWGRGLGLHSGTGASQISYSNCDVRFVTLCCCVLCCPG